MAREAFGVSKADSMYAPLHMVQTSDSVPPKPGLTAVLDGCPRKLYKWYKHQHHIDRRDICSSHSTLSTRLMVTN
jgi:hypothetical protein